MQADEEKHRFPLLKLHAETAFPYPHIPFIISSNGQVDSQRYQLNLSIFFFYVSSSHFNVNISPSQSACVT